MLWVKIEVINEAYLRYLRQYIAYIFGIANYAFEFLSLLECWYYLKSSQIFINSPSVTIPQAVASELLNCAIVFSSSSSSFRT